MLKIPVLADKIKTLTDARYFASWGVDGIIFWLENPGAISQLIEIAKWIEGPKMYVNGPGLVPGFTNVLTQDQISDPPEAFLLRSGGFGELEIRLFANWKVEGILLEQKTPIPDQSFNYLLPQIYVAEFQIPDELESLAQEQTGIILNGSPEEKTGLKAFDDYDKIFSFLQV